MVDGLEAIVSFFIRLMSISFTFASFAFICGKIKGFLAGILCFNISSIAFIRVHLRKIAFNGFDARINVQYLQAMFYIPNRANRQSH